MKHQFIFIIFFALWTNALSANTWHELTNLKHMKSLCWHDEIDPLGMQRAPRLFEFSCKYSIREDVVYSVPQKIMRHALKKVLHGIERVYGSATSKKYTVALRPYFYGVQETFKGDLRSIKGATIRRLLKKGELKFSMLCPEVMKDTSEHIGELCKRELELAKSKKRLRESISVEGTYKVRPDEVRQQK